MEVFPALLSEVKSELSYISVVAFSPPPPSRLDAIKGLTGAELTLFSANNLETVRVSTTAV